MTREEYRVASAIFTWLEIKSRSDSLKPEVLTAEYLHEEARQSALLPRLLSGKQPLDNPPPLSFGTPWYDIVEVGRARVMAEPVPNDLRKQFPNHIFINGFPWWVQEEAEDDSYMVSWAEDGPTYWLARGKGSDCKASWSLMRVFR